MKISLPLSKLALFAVAVVFVSSPGTMNAQSLWNATNGISVNTNWSSTANWLPNVVPTASSNVVFNDSAATPAPGIVNNVVDANTTIQQLVFRQTNGVHNTLILPGMTLTISNAVPATNLLAGTETTTSAATLAVTNTISGAGGTLAMTSTNISSVIVVRQISATAGSHIETLDLSGLDTFNASIGNVWVGVFPGGTTTRPQGALFLAKTNTITALAIGTKLNPSIDVGDTGSSPDVGNTLALGITNSITADTMVVGNQRSGGILKFNPIFTNSLTPSLVLRGHSGNRVVTFNLGDNSSATAAIGSACSGVVDFTGGTVDAMVGSMTLGDGQPLGGSGATGTATGTLTLTAGTINVNTLEVGFQNTNGSSAVNSGTVNVNGGTLTVNTSMRLALYNGAGGVTRGTLNITNGTVQVTNIVAGGGTSAINMSGGTLNVTNTIGSPSSALSSLSISGGATLQFAAANGVTPCEVTNLTSDSTGVINISSLPALAGYPSQFPLITYQGGSGSGLTFSIGTLPGTFTGTISNDNASTIWLVVTNGPNLASATWGGGVNNLWDTSTLNWTNNGNAVKYQDPDVVTFNDGAKTNKVNVTATFAPAGWAQNNNTLNYIFNGAGGITGSGGLTMNGTASVTLAQSGGDNFTGGIAANAGTVILDDANNTIAGGLTIASGATVQIGNNDANGNLPSGAVDDEGVLIFSRSDNFLVSPVIPGSGTLTQNGSGTLTLSASNTYSGITTVSAGTLALTNLGALPNSSQINVTGATLDVSGISRPITLANLNLVNASLTASVGAVQTNLTVTSLTMGGTTNFLNVVSLPPIASYPTTVTVVQSPNGISGFNMGAGTLPGGFTGSVALSGDTTAILLTLTSGPIGVRSNVTWIGTDVLNSVNTNWSDRLNWQLPGAPVAGDNVIFNNAATSLNGSSIIPAGGGTNALIPGNLDNIVDTSVSIASLTYTNNGGTFHNTGITNGATLSVTNFMTVGTVDSASVLQQAFVNVSGSGGATLNVNNTNASFQVWVGNSGTAASFAALDLSALDNFTANVNRVGIGACTVNNAVNRPSGILYLARTNAITCVFQTTNSETGSTTGVSGIILGDCNQNQGPTSFIYLGEANTISSDTITIARQKSSGTIQFNPIYVNIAPYPSVTFGGFSSSLVSIFDVGDGAGNTGTTAGTGDLNLAGGFVTAAVDTMNIGRASAGASGAGTTTGTLEFDAGTITANTVNIGLQPVIGAKVGVGTATVGTNSTIGASASLVVNGTLSLGVNVNNTNAQSTAGTVNINGGTVQANTIVAGTNSAPSTINLNAGTLIITGSAGTPAAPLTTLGLSDGTVLQLSVDGSANISNVVATAVTTSGNSQTVTLRIAALPHTVVGVTYPLISYTGGDPFSSLKLAPLPTGYVGSLIDNSGVVGLKLTTVSAPAQPAHITSISVSGTTLHLTATNGVSGGPFVLFGSTNLTLPLNQWTPILTNNFNGSGNLNLTTNIVNPAVPREFYILSQ